MDIEEARALVYEVTRDWEFVCAKPEVRSRAIEAAKNVRKITDSVFTISELYSILKSFSNGLLKREGNLPGTLLLQNKRTIETHVLPVLKKELGIE